ncbi:Ger(x)C family spore germination protein [Piscibacillus halophilus]|nr:Ger(x)C family spore germination protein [Piscibacillus halophilus]
MSESKPFVTGKIEVISVSQEIAQNGIMPLTDGFIRDPSVGSRVFLFVAENTANELLQGQYSSQDNGMFISDMLAQNVERGPLPNTNIHLFFNQFYDKGSDPFLPLLGLRNNKIKILGLALLKDDKMAGKIGLKDLFAFKTLQEKNTKGDHYLVKLDDGNEVYLNKISSKWKVNMTNLETSPKVEYDVNLNLAIREFSGDKLDQARIKKIKDKIEEQFKQEAEEMIQYFQELKVDPLGIGSLARSRLRSWNKEKWQDQYPNIEVVVNSKVKISETGIAE